MPKIASGRKSDKGGVKLREQCQTAVWYTQPRYESWTEYVGVWSVKLKQNEQSLLADPQDTHTPQLCISACPPLLTGDRQTEAGRGDSCVSEDGSMREVWLLLPTVTRTNCSSGAWEAKRRGMEDAKRCCWGYGSNRYLRMTSRLHVAGGAPAAYICGHLGPTWLRALA